MNAVANLLDRAIGTLFPAWGLSRLQARTATWSLEAFTGSMNGYDAGKLNRLTSSWNSQRINENAVPSGQISRLRASSVEMFRNNPHARKVIRQLEAKVIGPRGMTPQSQAMRDDGTPHVEFRKRAQELWAAVSTTIDNRGRPGKGGETLAGLQKTMLRTVVLLGEGLFMPRAIGATEAAKLELQVPLTVQLIDAERLDETLDGQNGNDRRVYRGIEIDRNQRRLAYHLWDYHPNDPVGFTGNSSRRYSAENIWHLFATDDIEQMRGTPWFAALLMQMRDTNDYQYNELKSAAVAACAVMGVRRATGQNGAIGLQDSGEITDADGNPLTKVQPGMIFNLGRDGEIQTFNPQRQGGSVSDFINHMVRVQAAGAPGIKSSSLTGDYRNSSFSSEKSADNDAWPELECVQEWFAAGFNQPLYEQLVIAGMLAGWFDGVISAEEFADNKAQLVRCHWQGPVSLSINETDAAKAQRMRIQNGTSSPQIECAKTGVNWRDILADIAEFKEAAEDADIAPDLIQQYLGIDQIDSTQPGATGENPLNDPLPNAKQTSKAAA